MSRVSLPPSLPVSRGAGQKLLINLYLAGLTKEMVQVINKSAGNSLAKTIAASIQKITEPHLSKEMVQRQERAANHKKDHRADIEELKNQGAVDVDDVEE